MRVCVHTAKSASVSRLVVGGGTRELIFSNINLVSRGSHEGGRLSVRTERDVRHTLAQTRTYTRADTFCIGVGALYNTHCLSMHYYTRTVVACLQHRESPRARRRGNSDSGRETNINIPDHEPTGITRSRFWSHYKIRLRPAILLLRGSSGRSALAVAARWAPRIWDLDTRVKCTTIRTQCFGISDVFIPRAAAAAVVVVSVTIAAL